MVYRDTSCDPPVSLGEEESAHDDPYDFNESDSDSGTPYQLGSLEIWMDIDWSEYRNWNVDEDIADTAGLSAKAKGKQRERQVPLSHNKHLLTTPQCTRGSTSTQAKEEPLGSDVDYRCALKALVNSLNKIELHTQDREKCK
jgi:hypothetical protein